MKLTMIALISGCVCNTCWTPSSSSASARCLPWALPARRWLPASDRPSLSSSTSWSTAPPRSPVHLRRKALRPDLSLEGRLYAIGVPAILNLALPSLLVTFLNGLLAAFSS